MAEKKLSKKIPKAPSISGEDGTKGQRITGKDPKEKSAKRKKVVSRGKKGDLAKESTKAKSKSKSKAGKPSKAATECLKHTDIILNGSFISCDPSSGTGSGDKKSNPYFCRWDKGVLTDTWGVEIKSGWSKYKRIRYLADSIREMDIETDLLVIEDVGVIYAGGFSRVEKSLMWSVGAIIAGLSPENVVEVKPISWQAMINKKTYIKSDRNDAVGIGWFAVQTALGTKDKLPDVYIEGVE